MGLAPGDANFLILRIHPPLTVGKTIPNAFLSIYAFENFCHIKIDAQSGGELAVVDPQIVASIPRVKKVAAAAMEAMQAWPMLPCKLDLMDLGYKT